MLHAKEIITKLQTEHKASGAELLELLRCEDVYIKEELRKAAQAQAQETFGKAVYLRGLIEFSNFCKNDCLYCGIRKSNRSCSRYRLTEEDILSCCKEGYNSGFRTFVMQGGEVGRDIHVFRDLVADTSEEAIDREAAYILEFEKSMMRK